LGKAARECPDASDALALSAAADRQMAFTPLAWMARAVMVREQWTTDVLWP